MFGKNRSYLMGIVGGYLIYLAYQLYESIGDPDTTMTMPMRIVFIALFVLIGIGLLIFAFRLWFAADREEKENKTEQTPGNENSLK